MMCGLFKWNTNHSEDFVQLFFRDIIFFMFKKVTMHKKVNEAVAEIL